MLRSRLMEGRLVGGGRWLEGCLGRHGLTGQDVRLGLISREETITHVRGESVLIILQGVKTAISSTALEHSRCTPLVLCVCVYTDHEHGRIRLVFDVVVAGYLHHVVLHQRLLGSLCTQPVDDLFHTVSERARVREREREVKMDTHCT